MATFFRLAVVGALLVSAQFAEARLRVNPNADPNGSGKVDCQYALENVEKPIGSWRSAEMPSSTRRGTVDTPTTPPGTRKPSNNGRG